MLLFWYLSLCPWELLQSNGNRSVVFVGWGEQGRKQARKESLKAWVLEHWRGKGDLMGSPCLAADHRAMM